PRFRVALSGLTRNRDRRILRARMSGPEDGEVSDRRILERSEVLDFRAHFQGRIESVTAYLQKFLADPAALARMRNHLGRNHRTHRLLALSVPDLVRELARQVSLGEFVLIAPDRS